MKISLIIFIISFFTIPASAIAISNGGFETGSFSNWQSIGITSVENSSYGSSPSSGSFQALIDTGSFNPLSVSPNAIERFLGVPSGYIGSLSLFGPGINYGSAIKQTFSVTAGETVAFQWNFLTNDGRWNNQDPDYRDYAFVTLIGPDFIHGEHLADTLGGISSHLDPNPFLSSSTTFNLESGYQGFSFTSPSSGNLTLGLGVVDHNFPGGAAGLLIDQVNSFQTTPEPSTFILFSTGLLGFLGIRKLKMLHS